MWSKMEGFPLNDMFYICVCIYIYIYTHIYIYLFICLFIYGTGNQTKVSNMPGKHYHWAVPQTLKFLILNKNPILLTSEKQ
jgi:hypothetical protein